MNVVRITVETDKGFVHEVGQCTSMEEAIRSLEKAREDLKLERVPEDDPYDRYTVKLRWTDDEIPW